MKLKNAIKIKILLYILILLPLIQLSAQQKFSFEIGSGFEASLWELKRKHIYEDNFYLRVSNSEIKPTIPVKLSLVYSKKRFKFGFEVINQLVIVNIRGNSSSAYLSDVDNTYEITDDFGVYLLTYMASFRYSLVNNISYKLTPSIGIGSFTTKEIIDQRQNTSSVMAYKFSLQSEFHNSRKYFYIAPLLLVNRYSNAEDSFRTLIYTGGIELGIGLKFPN